MSTPEKGTTPMKKVETQQFVFRIVMAFIFLMILLYASIAFSNERVVTIPDGDRTWKMSIHPQEFFPAQAKQPAQLSDTLQVIPVQHTTIVDTPGLAPPPPEMPHGKVLQTSTVPPVPQNLPVASTPATETICPPTTSTYEAIYRSIRFSRAEYLANPSYRHEATMEMMMGQLRPTVINKTYRARVQGSFPARLPYRTHYRLAPLDRSWYNRYPYFGGAIRY